MGAFGDADAWTGCPHPSAVTRGMTPLGGCLSWLKQWLRCPGWARVTLRTRKKHPSLAEAAIRTRTFSITPVALFLPHLQEEHHLGAHSLSGFIASPHPASTSVLAACRAGEKPRTRHEPQPSQEDASWSCGLTATTSGHRHGESRSCREETVKSKVKRKEKGKPGTPSSRSLFCCWFNSFPPSPTSS